MGSTQKKHSLPVGILMLYIYAAVPMPVCLVLMFLVKKPNVLLHIINPVIDMCIPAQVFADLPIPNRIAENYPDFPPPQHSLSVSCMVK